MNYRHFVSFNIIGAVLWGVGLPLLGWVLGDRVPFVRDNLDVIFIVIVLISVLPIAIEVFRGWRSNKKKQNPSEEAV